jgi:hypothetical protein
VLRSAALNGKQYITISKSNSELSLEKSLFGERILAQEHLLNFRICTPGYKKPATKLYVAPV